VYTFNKENTVLKCWWENYWLCR